MQALNNITPLSSIEDPEKRFQVCMSRIAMIMSETVLDPEVANDLRVANFFRSEGISADDITKQDSDTEEEIAGLQEYAEQQMKEGKLSHANS